MPTTNFYLALIAFLISLGSGIYFLVWWFKSGRRYRLLLCWACGLGSLLWFKIPNIIANAKIEVVQEDLYPFFFVTLLIYFLAYFALIRGFAFFTKFSNGESIVGLFALWFWAAILYFASSFLVQNIGVSDAPVWVGHLLFYIPSQIFLLYELWRVTKRPARPFIISNTSIALTAMGIISLLMSSVLYIAAQAITYPKEFWYFAVIYSSNISSLQIISGILLFFGLRGFMKSYLRITRQDDRSVS